MLRMTVVEENGYSEESIEVTNVVGELNENNHPNICLLSNPTLTLKYAACEIFIIVTGYMNWLCEFKTLITLNAVFLLIIYLSSYYEGPHLFLISYFEEVFTTGLYWVGLGVLSSIGLGTGLHTFILYLGPFIASVTLAAWECGTVDFPKPEYPREILCPKTATYDRMNMSLGIIFNKIKFESFLWGLGTALGELPPFFMARAAKLSNNELLEQNESLAEYDKLQKLDIRKMSLSDKSKAFFLKAVHKFGFYGILLLASIPNPMFDLAGIACGHCLVPFKVFFFATLLGKAIIKLLIQANFVIICFSPYYEDIISSFLKNIPFVGITVQSMIEQAIKLQKKKLHKLDDSSINSFNYFNSVFGMFVMSMVIYFIFSIINSMARSYQRRFLVAILSSDRRNHSLSNNTGFSESEE